MAGVKREMHILVLGASGKLGRMLRRWWRENPPEGFAIHWQYRESPPDDGLLWRPGMAPPEGVPKFQAILALWGVTPGRGRDLAENRALAMESMALGRALGAGRVLHCSSAAVYAPGPRAPFREAQAGGAVNAYGAAKLEMEDALGGWAGPPRACAMRIANVIGADSLFAAMAQGSAVTLDRFADGEGPRRSYVSIPALARACLALARCSERDLPAAVNVALPRPMAMEALARAGGCDIKWRPAPDSAAPMVALDTGRLEKLVTLEEESPEALIAGWRALAGTE